MSFTWKPHPVIRDPRSGVPMIDYTQAKEFIMLSNADERVFVQEGTIYFGDLDQPCAPEAVPGWFWDAYRALTPEARKSCGLKLPEDEIQTVEQLPSDFRAMFDSLNETVRSQLLALQEVPSEVPRMPQDETSPEPVPVASPPPKDASSAFWECPECGDQLTKRTKGVHIAKHRRDQYARERALDTEGEY